MRDVIAELKSLRLHGMAATWAELGEQNNGELERSRWLVEHMLMAEASDRATRSVSHQMATAKFPVHRDLAGFDFEVSPVDRKLVAQLASCEFTQAAHNAVLVGGPGTGKSHLATAIGVAGITEHGKRVRFYSTVDLVNALEREKAEGKAGRIAGSLLRMDLVVLDELGYLPFSQAGGRAAVPPAEQAVRAHQRRDHDQPGLRGVVHRLRRREDDHGVAGPAHAPLPHRGDRQRELPGHAGHGQHEAAHQGPRAGTQGQACRARLTPSAARREASTGYALRVFPPREHHPQDRPKGARS
jgi:hypothetical protein